MTRYQNKPRAVLAFCVAAAMTAFGFWEYASLAEWEHTGGTRRMNAVGHLLYELGGKPAVLAMFLAVAGYVFFLGLKHLRGRPAL